jgi:hypothetical protein
MFALQATTINEPMSETNSFVSENRFDSGFSSEGEHKVRPTLVSDIGWILVLVSEIDEFKLFPLTFTYAHDEPIFWECAHYLSGNTFQLFYIFNPYISFN